MNSPGFLRTLERALGCLASVAVLLGTIAVPRAQANADPASDVLLAAPAFYPTTLQPSLALRKTLEQALRGLAAKGLDLKVAILSSPIDLGGAPSYWNQPQAYADFLDREISFNRKQSLLVVMPAGFGVSNAGPAQSLTGLTVDASHGSDGLVHSAIEAVVAIARANGKAIPMPSIPTSGPSSKGGGTSPVIVFGAPVALVVLVALVAALMRRRTPDDDEPAASP